MTSRISKANATINVSGYSGTYDGLAHGRDRQARRESSRLRANLNNLLHLGSSFTDFPGGTAYWTFDGNNDYNSANGSVLIVIGKANQTISWNTPADIIFGTPLSGTQFNATVSGVPNVHAGACLGPLDVQPAGGNRASPAV